MGNRRTSTPLALLLLLVAAAMPPAAAADVQPVTPDQITAVIDSVLASFDAHYVYPDTAQALIRHIRGKLDAGGYRDVTDLQELTRQLSVDMRSFTNDRHIWISVMSPDDPPAVEESASAQYIARAAAANFGFKQVECLQGNIGYVRFDFFHDAAYAGDAAVAAMNFVARCDAVILDLRANHGGHETMVRLIASYFFDKPTLLNSLYFTEADSLEQSWTQAYVPGPRMPGADLYILTSKATGSGAEAFSYAMKHAGRATLIGETTVGAAHWSEAWDFPDLGVRAQIPIARPINPVTRTSWERTGVTPHIDVPAAEALPQAHVLAIETLLERVADDAQRATLEWGLPVARARLAPVRLTNAERTTYCGKFAGDRYALLNREGALWWRYADGTEYRLVPLTRDLFGFADDDGYRVEFVRDGADAVTGFRLFTSDGNRGPVRERSGDL